MARTPSVSCLNAGKMLCRWLVALPPRWRPPPRRRVGSHSWAGAVHDLAGADLTAAQQQLLLDLVRVYVDRLPETHASAKLDEVVRHLDETHFAWRGGSDDECPFYYRIHSPVLLVEYDNHPGVFLANTEAARYHIHTIVREPNGNDYGKDLLTQPYATHHNGRLATLRGLRGKSATGRPAEGGLGGLTATPSCTQLGRRGRRCR